MVIINVAGVKTTPKISSTPLLVASQLLPGVTAKPSYSILAITPPSDGSFEAVFLSSYSIIFSQYFQRTLPLKRFSEF